jgi:hypothetical protein
MLQNAKAACIANMKVATNTPTKKERQTERKSAIN